MVGSVSAFSLPGIAQIEAGHDLAAEIVEALGRTGESLQDGDVVVVASKVVAKAEGRTVPDYERDAAITAEATHLVAARALADGRLTRVVHTSAGPVLAAAGVDASDVQPGTVLLLPVDADESARRLRAALVALTGTAPGVLVTDTSGRPWRSGVSDYCLGAAGVAVLDDRRGALDASGHPLSVTVRNLADEIACLADLVKAKAMGTPVAIVRGLASLTTDDDGPGARVLVRSGPSDWFRHGHVEAVWSALARAGVVANVRAPAIDPDAEDIGVRLNRAISIALACPGADEVAVDHSGVRAGGDATRRIAIQGPHFAVGRVLERMLSAAWAEDVDLRVETTADTLLGCEVTMAATRR